ncbi:hypothetical protein ACF0H5_007192 [Mactra antiquata]
MSKFVNNNSIIRLVTLSVLISLTLAAMDDRRFLYNYLREERRIPTERQCVGKWESCIPGAYTCCYGDCRNKFSHVCLYPLETCYCVPDLMTYSNDLY